MTDARTETLAALITWAGTNRADLVAAAWRAGNRNISELARAARRGRDVIYDDLRKHGIDPETDRQEPPVPTPAATTNKIPAGMTELPVPGWRHPYLLQVFADPENTPANRAGLGRSWASVTKPFTGHEPEPKIPEEWLHQRDDETDWKPAQQRSHEIRLARQAWAYAHFAVRTQKAIRSPYGYGSSAAAMWSAFVDARDKLVAAYADLENTPDNMWRAAILKINAAKEPAREAASNWDGVGEEFAKLNAEFIEKVGEDNWPGNTVVAEAAKLDVDAKDWLIGTTYDYLSDWGTPPAHSEITRIVEEGDQRIKAVLAFVRDGESEDDGYDWEND